MVNQATEAKISCRDIWKVFGTHISSALSDEGLGLSREELLQRMGCVIAVRDVTFDVREGEIFVVMGLSGSGKSTLIRCLSRLVEPTQGQVVIDGEDVTKFDARHLRDLRRRKLAMVFQHFGLFAHRRVLENAVFGLEVQGVDKATRNQRALEMLKMVGLGGWEQRYPRELSGGMQQRVGLARALAVEPEILLFDEPFSALDPLIRRDMQDELINLQKVVKKTIIFITHDFLEALKLGERIAIMKDGYFVQTGTAEEVVSQPADDYVKDFTLDVPRGKVLSAKSIMTSVDSAIVSITQEPRGVFEQMSASGEVCRPVVSEDGAYQGIVLHSDLTSAVDRGLTDLKEIASTNGSVATLGTLLEDLVPLTIASDLPICIVDDGNKLCGMVSRASVVSALAGKS